MKKRKKWKMEDKFNDPENVRLRCILLLITMIMCLGADQPPLSVTLTSPADGSVLSGIVNFTGVATSLNGPVQRVEIWDAFNGVSNIVAVWSNTLAPPGNFRVMPKTASLVLASPFKLEHQD